MQFFNNKTILAGAGTALVDIVFLRGMKSRVVAKLAGAGTSTVEYTIDDQEDVRSNPVAATIDWIDAGAGPVSATPVVFDFDVPVTAVRIKPVTVGGVLKAVSSN